MIIKCEECKSKFNLDDNMLKESGSRVRCSVCKNIFTAFPSSPEPLEEYFEDDSDIAMEETVALDSPPPLMDTEEQTESDDEKGDDEFEKAFEDALQEEIPDDDTYEPVEPAPQSEQKKKSRSKLLLIILVIIFVFILGALTVYFFAPSLLPGTIPGLKPSQKEDMADSGNSKLDWGDVDGSFLNTDKIGQLFIIRGKIINNYSDSRSHILIKGTIEDSNKKPIRRKLVYAGNIYSDKQLKEMTMEEIDRGLKNQTGIDNANINVKPGGQVPFMIIFDNLPDNLGEFEVEPVSSSPGE
jgi:predicted Zn finger-like uncharacterized protein